MFFYEPENICDSDRSNYTRLIEKAYDEEEPKLIKSQMNFEKISVEPKVVVEEKSEP